jgi:serine/threonine protein kinase
MGFEKREIKEYNSTDFKFTAVLEGVLSPGKYCYIGPDAHCYVLRKQDFESIAQARKYAEQLKLELAENQGRSPHVVPYIGVMIEEQDVSGCCFVSIVRGMFQGETIASIQVDKLHNSGEYKSVDEALATNLGLAEAVIARLAFQLLTGLATIHSQGKVHGNILPTNVLIAPDGQAMLLDAACFNYFMTNSRIRDREDGGYRIPFVDPAIIASSNPEKDFSTTMDIYALGAVLLETFLGVPLIASTGLETMDFLDQVLKGKLALLDLLSKRKPSENFRRFLNQMLYFDPAERATAAELLQHPFLQNALELTPTELYLHRNIPNAWRLNALPLSGSPTLFPKSRVGFFKPIQGGAAGAGSGTTTASIQDGAGSELAPRQEEDAATEQAHVAANLPGAVSGADEDGVSTQGFTRSDSIRTKNSIDSDSDGKSKGNGTGQTANGQADKAQQDGCCLLL